MGKKHIWYEAMVALSTGLTQTPPQPILLSGTKVTTVGNKLEVPLTEEEYLELEANWTQERNDYFHLGHSSY
ncbi:hypothetical protein WA1_49320 [Scytonema hofmannii PCC 7110]|uniref:Uncharacterized protein n=1 Tax=Scytonema hofmannii PCC 7110 TaxID=128403 RepID=A0A139WQQ1_9CYAN|nr:hypothetical protein [Scytonema hofmannii]KYC34741.1 hypothetical protein WA1_49320 [Scytonema hofmannii PCC 7110]